MDARVSLAAQTPGETNPLNRALFLQSSRVPLICIRGREGGGEGFICMRSLLRHINAIKSRPQIWFDFGARIKVEQGICRYVAEPNSVDAGAGRLARALFMGVMVIAIYGSALNLLPQTLNPQPLIPNLLTFNHETEGLNPKP